MEEDDPADLAPEALIRMATIETLNQGEVEEAAKYFTDDATYYNSDDEEGSLQDLKDDSLEFHNAFPDMEAEIDEVVVDDDVVSFHYIIRGSFENAFGEIPPNGEFFEAGGIGFARIKDGRISEYDIVYDRLGTMQQLGVM